MIFFPYGMIFFPYLAFETCSLALSERGDVYAWGSNSDYQLGLPNSSHQSTEATCCFGPKLKADSLARWEASFPC